MLSEVGKDLYFPKGILTQGAEAKEKAHRFNATIGMATEKGRTMYLPSVMADWGLEPERSPTPLLRPHASAQSMESSPRNNPIESKSILRLSRTLHP
jgi:hypothetical protein